MKLLIYSYFPLLSRHQAGGAQLMLRALIERFKEKEVSATVICPETDQQLLDLPNIKVLPVLKEKGKKPLTFQERLHNNNMILEQLCDVDAVWTIDETFPIRTSKPIILTLQTIAYEEELTSLFGWNWDCLIVASDYLYKLTSTFLDTVDLKGEFPELRKIVNGIDTGIFIPTLSNVDLKKSLGIPQGRYILFPHRPEPEKGFELALMALRELVNIDNTYRLLIPTHPLSAKYCVEDEKLFQDHLRCRIAALNLKDNVVFHTWVDYENLPAYYSLGEWCWNLSVLPEGFGLAPVQSVACGTPVISTRSGALRLLFPEAHGVKYINPGNIQEIVTAVLTTDFSYEEIYKGQRYIREHYSLENCAEQYISAFKNTHKKRDWFVQPPKPTGRFEISPWCYIVDKSYAWHDLKMKTILLSDDEYLVLRNLNMKDKSLDEETYNSIVLRLQELGLIVESM